MSNTVNVSLLFGTKVRVALPAKGPEKADRFERGLVTHEIRLMKSGVRAFAKAHKGELHSTRRTKTPTGLVYEFTVSLPQAELEKAQDSLSRFGSPKLQEKRAPKTAAVTATTYWPTFRGLVKT